MMTSEFERLQQLMDSWHNNIVRFVNQYTKAQDHPLLHNSIRRTQYERTIKKISTMHLCLHLHHGFVTEQSCTLGTLATYIAGTRDYTQHKAAQNRLKPVLERLATYQLVTISKKQLSANTCHYCIMGTERLHQFFQQCFYHNESY